MNLRLLLWVIALASFTGILNTQWTFSDQRYQRDDTATLTESAQEVHLVARDFGVLRAAQFAYLHRHWRPVAAPLLLVPFLHTTHGDTREAFRFYSLVTSVALAILIFAALRAACASDAVAGVGTVLLLLTPWVLDDQFRLWSEMPWLIAAAGFWWSFFRKRWKSVCLFLILAMLCRPLESTIGLLIPFAALLIDRDFENWKAHLTFFLLESAAALSVAIHPSPEEIPLVVQKWIIVAVLVYAVLKFVWLRRSHPAWLNTQALWSAAWMVSFLWYLPGFATMWDWIALSTWGPGTRRLNLREHSEASVLPLFFANAAWTLWLPAGLLMVRRGPLALYWRHNKSTALFLLWTAFAMVSIGIFTVSRDFRYYQASWLALFIFVVMSVRSAYSARVTAAVLAVCLCIQAAGTLPHYFHLPRFQALEIFAGDLSSSRVTEEDHEFETFNDFLRAQNLDANAGLVFVDHRDREDVRLLINPWKHVLRARENGLFWRGAFFDNDWDPADSIQELIQMVQKSGDVLIVGGPYPEGDSRASQISRALFGCFDRDCSGFHLSPVAAFTSPSGHQLRIFKSENPHYVAPAAQEKLLRCWVEFQENLSRN